MYTVHNSCTCEINRTLIQLELILHSCLYTHGEKTQLEIGLSMSLIFLIILIGIYSIITNSFKLIIMI